MWLNVSFNNLFIIHQTLLCILLQKLLYLSGGKIIIKIPEVCYSVWIGLEIRKLVFFGGFFLVFLFIFKPEVNCTQMYQHLQFNHSICRFFIYLFIFTCCYGNLKTDYNYTSFKKARGYLYPIAATFMSRRLYLGEFWHMSSWTSAFQANGHRLGGTVVSFVTLGFFFFFFQYKNPYF